MKKKPLPASPLQKQYTRKGIALLGDISTRTIARDVRAGRLEEIKINRRRLRYSEEAVRAYLNGRT